MINKLVKDTIYFSLFIQILTSSIALSGVFINVDEKDKVLTEILILETFVQFVEAFFYVWVIYALKDLNIMTPRRYIDWCITTPIMLITTIIFMEYQYNLESKNNKIITMKEFFYENKENIIKIILFNALMLFFGFLGESQMINKPLAVTIGFYFFYMSFRIIYNEYAYKTKIGVNLFKFLTICWSLYGVAALADIKTKNISYNLLDIVSKNFYGLYIYYYIITIAT
jgi:hypothetical protein